MAKIVRKNVEVIPGSDKTHNYRRIERIDETLEEIRRVWKNNPDMRLTQLLWNLRDVLPPGLERTTIGKFYEMEEDVLLERLVDRYGEA